MTIFIGVNFFKTYLKGIDFSQCRLEGIKISNDFREFSGMITNIHQAANIAKLLGIVIK